MTPASSNSSSNNNPLTNFTSINPYYTFRTLQGSCLFTFAIATFVEIYHNYLKESGDSDSDGYESSDGSTTGFIYYTNTETTANQPLLHGWFIDSVSIMAMYIFVLLKFPKNQQRVSTVLL